MHFFVVRYNGGELCLKPLGQFDSKHSAFECAEELYGDNFEAIIDEATAADWMREFNIYCKETQANKGVNNNA